MYPDGTETSSASGSSGGARSLAPPDHLLAPSSMTAWGDIGHAEVQHWTSPHQNGERELVLNMTLQDATSVENPSWSHVQDVLLRMDGVSNSFVELNCNKPGSLWIAGGNERRYMVTFMMDVETQETRTLVDPSAENGVVEILIEGVASQYPARVCVGRELMLEAAKGFYDTCAIPDHLVWRSY